MKTIKEIPHFNSEKEERDFWGTHDATDYFDLSDAKKVNFPNLKKTTKSISLRLPQSMIDQLKVKANSMDVPYQSLIKMILDDGLKKIGA